MKNILLRTGIVKAGILLAVMACGASDPATADSGDGTAAETTQAPALEAGPSTPATGPDSISDASGTETSGTETPGTETPGTGTTSPAAPSLADMLEGDWRSEENKARDGARHPAETLSFFGLESNMTVVELWPGGGWYAEIIAPFVARGGGTYYAVPPTLSELPPRFAEYTQKGLDRLTGDPALFGNVRVSEFGNEGGELAPAGAADMVLTFRNVHNMMGRGSFTSFLTEAYAALRPGGILGIVEHRARTDTPQDPKAVSGYVREDFTIEAVTNAGFEFLASSGINANPLDTADHPFGVWTLPPSLRNAARGADPDPDFDQEKYRAIGESDRYTLKFQKPHAADGALLE